MSSPNMQYTIPLSLLFVKRYISIFPSPVDIDVSSRQDHRALIYLLPRHRRQCKQSAWYMEIRLGKNCFTPLFRRPKGLDEMTRTMRTGKETILNIGPQKLISQMQTIRLKSSFSSFLLIVRDTFSSLTTLIPRSSHFSTLDRLVESSRIKKALEAVYSGLLPKGASPFIYLRFFH